MWAAFALFDERGYDQTTVDEIAERAGVGRTTFFRLFRSKEDVIFPDHDRLLAAVRDRLAASAADTALLAVAEAVRLVLRHYVQEGELARRRYRLTSRIGPLRDREIVAVARYQRLFREFLDGWLAPADGAGLRAELMAAAVVAAHNQVLRRWLRGQSADPTGDLDAALAEAIALFTRTGPAGGSTIVVLHDQRDPDVVAAAIRRNLIQP
jgi:AcrR family transcriptional regulator